MNSAPQRQEEKRVRSRPDGTNLTAKAALGKVDKVVNRDAEIEESYSDT